MILRLVDTWQVYTRRRVTLVALSLLTVLVVACEPTSPTPDPTMTRHATVTALSSAPPWPTSTIPHAVTPRTRPESSVVDPYESAMDPEEAVPVAIKWARWPPVQRFGTLIGKPTTAVGSVMTFEEAWEYYSDSGMGEREPEEKDALVWVVVFEGEFDGTGNKPGCSHVKGPNSDWPHKIGEDDWKQTVVIMGAETGELMTRGMYHLGRLRNTDGLQDLKRYLP